MEIPIQAVAVQALVPDAHPAVADVLHVVADVHHAVEAAHGKRICIAMAY